MENFASVTISFYIIGFVFRVSYLIIFCFVRHTLERLDGNCVSPCSSDTRRFPARLSPSTGPFSSLYLDMLVSH